MTDRAPVESSARWAATDFQSCCKKQRSASTGVESASGRMRSTSQHFLKPRARRQGAERKRRTDQLSDLAASLSHPTEWALPEACRTLLLSSCKEQSNW